MTWIRNPYLNVTIYTDSKYVVGCMRTWIYKWVKNGFLNAKGVEVVNRDLIEKASGLDDEVCGLGDVEYVWSPRAENDVADCAVNECMDEQEAEDEEEGYSSSDDEDYY